MNIGDKVIVTRPVDGKEIQGIILAVLPDTGTLSWDGNGYGERYVVDLAEEFHDNFHDILTSQIIITADYIEKINS